MAAQGRRSPGRVNRCERIGDIGRPVHHIDAGAWDIATEAAVLRSIGNALGAPCKTRAQLEAILVNRSPLAIVVDEADRILAEPSADKVRLTSL